jgi:hypothetical protein
MYCNVISMCNITCIYNEICHITNEIFQAQITSDNTLNAMCAQRFTQMMNILNCLIQVFMQKKNKFSNCNQ